MNPTTTIRVTNAEVEDVRITTERSRPAAATKFVRLSENRSAKITRMHQYVDGYIFIYFDRSSDCVCKIPNRMAFHKDANEKFFMSAALTALTAGNLVTVTGDDVNCPVHGNTAKLTQLHILAK